ncbi:MAG: DUF1653 domain-containing protein [Ruminococcaceae bacterium]|nr:DUF1653 domain-containing protein [Oscillospiraceae bacterium]
MKAEIKPIESDIRGIYRHYKGGTYRVICMAHHSETLEDMVVYEPLDGTTGYWVRPASMWNEAVCVDGVIRPRFEKIKE